MAGTDHSTIKQHIVYITLVVRDYDEAIAFYTEMMGFDLIEDTALGGGNRWDLLELTRD